MAQSLRQLKTRIRATENIKKITKAMEMISVAKLKPIENMLISVGQYFHKIDFIVKSIIASSQDLRHPLLDNRKKGYKTILCVITSDTGLCGMYNNNIIRFSEGFINKYDKRNISLMLIGKKGINHFKKSGIDIIKTYPELHGRYSRDMADDILQQLLNVFLSGNAEEIYIAYTVFESSSKFKPVIEKFLNIELNIPTKYENLEIREENIPGLTVAGGYIFEPGVKILMEEILPVYLLNKLRFIFFNTFASEHAARVISMGEATENAKDLLQNLILIKNKIRQAGITNEIIEVSSAAEALS